MKIERIPIKSTCKTCQGKIAFKLDTNLTTNIIPLLVMSGFVELKHFTKTGILYMESSDLILQGAFGQNLIQTSCKKKDCQIALSNLEDVLTKME